MKLFTTAVIATAALALFAPASAQAAPSARQTCQKMIGEGRGGGMSQTYCECMYRVADAVMDDDVKALTFDSWYNGTNNMKALEQLPNLGRVKKQLRTMQRSLKPNCG